MSTSGNALIDAATSKLLASQTPPTDVNSPTGTLPIANGGTGSTTASGARTNLGLGTIATQDANNVAITGGSVSGITDLAIADGGTGASTAANARTNLGLGTIATQDANNVSITGGSISGITDLAVADGGTGASTAENARLNLGAVGILSTVTGINGSATGSTNLYTVPGSRTAVITGAAIRLTSASGLTGTMNAGIGINVTRDNIFTSTTLTAFNTISEVYVFGGQGNRSVAVGSEVIIFEIDGAFGGTTTIAVDLIGYLI